MSERASALLDEARETLLALGRVDAVDADDTLAGIAADGVRRIEWSGSWLDEPYVPRPELPADRGDTGSLEHRLHELTDAFEELVEDFEGDDPIRNANGVQTASLAFAITGATAARLHRVKRSPRSTVGR